MAFRSAIGSEKKSKRPSGGKNQWPNQNLQSDALTFCSPLIPYGKVLHRVDFNSKEICSYLRVANALRRIEPKYLRVRKRSPLWPKSHECDQQGHEKTDNNPSKKNREQYLACAADISPADP